MADSRAQGRQTLSGLSKALFTSLRGDWQTPPELLKELDDEFGFTLDPCPPVAEEFEFRQDGLTMEWAPNRVFCNPPYGREIGKWVAKAWNEAQRGALVVLLVPARTDTSWWHDYCAKGEVRFIRGRLRFWKDGQEGDPAPFPSAIVVFRPERQVLSFQINQRNEFVDLGDQAACLMKPNDLQGYVLEEPIPFDTTQITSDKNYSQPQPGAPSHPLAKAGHAPAIASQTAVRRLTPVECCRLQGFPDDWMGAPNQPPDGPRYAALGDAVTVNVAEWIGRRLLEA